MPSATLEEYLEIIYKLSREGPVRPTPIAEAIGVSAPTVTVTLKRLKAQGLIDRKGSEVVLTKAGKAQALDIVRRHRIAERFLVDVLGLEWDEAHEEACVLEHALSPRVLSALEKYLDSPEFCPHGHPIPHADGSIEDVDATALVTFDPGCEVCIVQVPEDDDEMLSYLGSVGMYPGRVIEILEAAPFEGPLLIKSEGGTHAIGREVAGKILVTDVEADDG